MGRKLLVLAGCFVAEFFVLFTLLTVLMYALGVQGTYEPGSYKTSMTWNVTSLPLYAVAGFGSGWLCVRLAKEHTPIIYWLAGLIVIFGLVVAIGSMGAASTTEVRPDTVDPWTAMQKSVTPVWVSFIVPFFAAAGALIGGRLAATESAVPKAS